MPIPWVQIASTIARLGTIVVTGKDMTDQIRDFMRKRERSGNAERSTPDRLQQLEKAAEAQSQLNEQYNAQMELVTSALESIRKSMRTIIILLILAISLSIAAILIALLK